MKNADKPAIAAIVSEMLGSRETMPNEEMAQAVFARLGIPVSRKDISALRTEMGLNMYQRIEQERETALRDGVEKLQREFRDKGVGELPWLALAAIVTLKWDNDGLLERNRELSEALDRAKRRLRVAR